MKYIWEESDIRAGRVIYAAEKSKKSKLRDFSSTRTYKIGFCHALTGIEGGSHLCLISMTDGMVCCTQQSRASMMAHLNKEGYIPLSHEQFISIMNSQPLMNAHGN